VSQLAQHARVLAGWHEIGPAREPDRPLPRLTENEIALREAYALVTDAVDARPAGASPLRPNGSSTTTTSSRS